MTIDGSKLSEFVRENKKASETFIPYLIRRLIKKEVDEKTLVNMPSGDAVSTKGYDGVLKVNKSNNAYVPEGKSYWEIGTNRDSLAKVKRDYEKRKKEKPDCTDITYVAVSTGILDTKKKEDFLKDSNKDGYYKKVCLIDANDIANWASKYLDICKLIYKEYNSNLNNITVITIDEEWERISDTDPKLCTSIFTNNHKGIKSKLIDSLKNHDERVINITSKYGGAELAYMFTIAAFMENDYIKERTLICNSEWDLKIVNSVCKDRIVLLNFSILNEKLITRNNNVYVFFDFPSLESNYELENIEQNEFEELLKLIGISSSKATELSFASSYNLLSLRRILSKNELDKCPKWAREKNSSELIPIALLGRLNFNDVGDTDILASIIDVKYDDYIDNLNKWVKYLEPPIRKSGGIYTVISRRECLETLSIESFSNRIQSLILKMTNAISNVYYSYTDENFEFYEVGIKQIWNPNTIINILDGFIILSGLNRDYLEKFDNFVLEILNNIFGDFDLTASVAKYFVKFAELSPSIYLRYLSDIMEYDVGNYNKLLGMNIDKNNYYVKQNIADAFDMLLREKYEAHNAFDCLLRMYNLYPNSTELEEKIIQVLSPYADRFNFVNISYDIRLKAFFEFIKDKDSRYYENIVQSIYDVGAKGVWFPKVKTYKIYEIIEKPISEDSFLIFKRKALSWILDHKNKKEMPDIIRIILDDIRDVKVDKEYIDKTNQIVNDLDNDVKLQVYKVILAEIESIIKNDEEEKNNEFLEILYTFSKSAMPKDTHFMIKHILYDDDWPIEHPPLISNEEYCKKEQEQKIEEKKKWLIEIIGKEGDRVIEELIEDAPKESSLIWEALFSVSSEHNRDIEMLIAKNNDNGMKTYLNKLNNKEIQIITENNIYNHAVLRNLPYRKEVIKIINETPYEEYYWASNYPRFDGTIDSKLESEKFLKFAPYRLLLMYAYRKDIEYDLGIRLLKRISDRKIEKLLQNTDLDVYALRSLVDKMDNKFYTDELSEIEFSLLPVLLYHGKDYPTGIKKYFWVYPLKLADMLNELYLNKDKLNKNGFGFRMLLSIETPIRKLCFVPCECMLTEKDKIEKWAGQIMDCSTEKTKNLLLKAVINTFVCCPKEICGGIWPIKEVADVLERLSSFYKFGDEKIANDFASSYINMDDASWEGEDLVRAAELEKYRDYYCGSHPATSLALNKIIRSYFYFDELSKEDCWQ